MKYFGIIDKNVAAIFQLQWKIENISDMFLQYSVLSGRGGGGYCTIKNFDGMINHNKKISEKQKFCAFYCNYLQWISVHV